MVGFILFLFSDVFYIVLFGFVSARAQKKRFGTPRGQRHWTEGVAVQPPIVSTAAGFAPMARVFVGNLPENVHERDLVDKFDRFGRIASVRIKIPTRPPPFAFIVSL